jgi:hypothetical protein
MINAPVPIAVAKMPDRLPLALLSMACTAAALSGPNDVRKFAKQRTFRRFLTEGEPGNRE